MTPWDGPSNPLPGHRPDWSRSSGWGGRTTGGVHSAWVWCLAQETARQGAGVASLTRKRARRLVPRYRGYTVVSGQSCGPWPPDRGPSDVGGVPPRKGGLCQRSRSGAHPATCGRWAVPTVPAPAARRMVRPEIKGLTIPREPSPAARACPTKTSKSLSQRRPARSGPERAPGPAAVVGTPAAIKATVWETLFSITWRLAAAEKGALFFGFAIEQVFYFWWKNL